jgi:SAM-dependent methyltransferase
MTNDLHLDQAFWNQLYIHQETRWDIGYPSTPLKDYIDQLDSRESRILIPGCGNAHEAAYLIDAGFTNVCLLDISSEVVKKLQQKWSGKPVKIICQDFFEHQGSYDLVFEQTFFCALDPSLRPAYVKKMFDLLVPGGKLIGVLFNRSFEGGPPFGGNEKEYRELFSVLFREIKMELCYNSILPRKDTELFFMARK